MPWNNYQNLYFTTATILEWKHLLKNDFCKLIVIDSLQFLRKEERAYIHAFVIMPNHIHLIWTIPGRNSLQDVKANLLSWTAHQFKKHLKQNHPIVLERFRVDLKDRQYQFWERNAFSFPIYHDKMFYQKMNYIHENPCSEKWNLADLPQNYKFSSAYMGYPSVFWPFVSP
jgi:putative transposase